MRLDFLFHLKYICIRFQGTNALNLAAEAKVANISVVVVVMFLPESLTLLCKASSFVKALLDPFHKMCVVLTRE